MMTVPLPVDTSALRRGACPSIAAPMQTGDGLLVRLRPVAPALMAEDLLALVALAREHGNGLIEITARGNLQLRGLTVVSVPRLADGLAAAGIVPQTGAAIEVPPFAGADPSEIADAGPIAGALRAALTEAGFALAPKLAIVVDGGGVLSLADMVGDIRLDAVRGGHAVLWRLSVGGDRKTARVVTWLSPEGVVEGTITVLAVLAQTGPHARGRDLDAAALSALFERIQAPFASKSEMVHPLGIHRIGEEAVLGLAPAYGQVHADRLAALVGDLAALGASEFRLAPHRALLVRGLSTDAMAEAQASADRSGFWSSSDAPGRNVSICAGAAGCASAGFDTRVAADAVVAHLAGLLDGTVDVHVSGCPKGCAHPAKAAVTLCGAAAGIGLVLDGRAGDPPVATLPVADLVPAIQRLGTLLRAHHGENETARHLLDHVAPASLISAYQGHS